MARYRDHRGSLAKSMETLRNVATRADLIAYLREDLGKWNFTFPDENVRIEPYTREDDRKAVHIVSVDHFGVVGFVEGDLT